jgi:hypothetical protein
MGYVRGSKMDHVLGLALWALLFCCLLQFFFAEPGPRTDRNSPVSPTDYIMWSDTESFIADCRQRLIGNKEWGKDVAHLVDKIDAKDYARQLSSSVKVIPTLAFFDKNNISFLKNSTFFQTLPQPFILKPAHASGSVAGVANNTYNCFKGCHGRGLPTKGSVNDNVTVSALVQRAVQDLEYDHSTKWNEMQYHPIPRRIIVETYLPLEKTGDVAHWYISNGVPVFVSVKCSDDFDLLLDNTDHQRRVFLTTDYQRLPITLSKSSCSAPPPKPKTWDFMQRIVKQELGPRIPGIVRVDLYASETDVHFSEFTFTPAACQKDFLPRVADGLLYAICHEKIPTSLITPEFVRDSILGTSWVHIGPFHDGALSTRLSSRQGSAFPSPVDLCRAINITSNSNIYDDCIKTSKNVSHQDIRCIVSQQTSNGSLYFEAIGAPGRPTWAWIWRSVDVGKVLALVLVILFVYTERRIRWSDVGYGRKCNSAVYRRLCLSLPASHKHKYNRLRANILYLMVMGFYMYLTRANVGLLSSHSLIHVLQESFQAFHLAHPASSRLMLLTHVGSHWILVSAWRANSLQGMLIWQLLYELVTVLVNECILQMETSSTTKCTHLVLSKLMPRYILDEIVRIYIVPPFSVYGYLLPKFILNKLGLLVVKT